MSSQQRIAIFPGSFDPFTVGHQSIVERGLRLFDKIIVAVGVNDQKRSEKTDDERIAEIKNVYATEPRVEVIAYSGLTVDIARDCSAEFILRGVRTVADYEYERSLADINRKISGMETVILYALPELAVVSSSVVRELTRYGRDVSEFLPKNN